VSVPELITTGPAAVSTDGPYRVVVVDDSVVIRGLISRCIEADPALAVVGTAANGIIALRQVERLKPDVVVLDIEMPEMDGLTALPRLLKVSPDLKVIMASTLTLRNADISLKALSAGAADYIPKPTSARELQGAEQFRGDLVAKIKALGAARRLRVHSAGTSPQAAIQSKPTANFPQRPVVVSGEPSIVLRAPTRIPPKILAIGASTGGPQALFKLFGYLKNRVNLPIVITQHMPATFTTILAEHLHRLTNAPCREARDGEPVNGGQIYIAPGDWHLTVEREGERRIIRLNQSAPENFCRPAVDPMLRSLSVSYGSQVVALILTGMGHDGLRGGQSVVDAGGTVLAQDEASSVVWGMPGAVAASGLCTAVLPIDDIGPALERYFPGAIT
jgi:two-component system chemotaxis response regulator CheB